MDKQKQHEQIFKDIERIANMLPAPIYWLNNKGITLGANDLVFIELGGLHIREKIVGKNHYGYYPKDVADNLTQNNQKVVELGKTIEFEERVVNLATGVSKYVTSVRSPLRDDEGTVIGIIGTSIDITAKKEAEQLRLANDNLMFENQRLEFENNAKQISVELDAYKKFKNIADQMAHDIGSPLMALSVLESHCAELPEAKRNMLRESISNIREIAGSLLSQYKPQENPVEMDNSDEFLVYAAIEQVILEKKHEYHSLPIKFICEYEIDSRFSFVKGDATSFKRMLSNLINNSVQAMENKPGIISITLGRENQYIKIAVTDNGKGMPQEIIDKIIDKIPITSGKDSGHGIGFNQIQETIQLMNGNLLISSAPTKGTTITLTLPQMTVPDWVTETINIKSNDIIIILDDDNSIHGAWDIRFGELLQTNPNIKVIHFTKAIEVMDHIGKLSEAEKQLIILLTDYELLKQNHDGLDVIQKTQIKRSILVTSHYSNPKIKQKANFSNIKILPKLLASFIPIKVAI